MNSGVYCIANNLNGKLYVGSSVNLTRRKRAHFSKLKYNHHNLHLQNAWNKYGGDQFEFIVLSLCPSEYVIKLEQWFINTLKPEYNVRLIAKSNKGYKHTDETKRKIAKSSKGRVWSEESRIKLSNKSKGKTISTEHRQAVANALRERHKNGYIHSRAKAVVMTTSEETRIFQTMQQAADYIGMHKNNIWLSCTKGCLVAKKYKFSYYEEKLETQEATA